MASETMKDVERKLAVFDALLAEVGERPLKDVRVGDVCGRAGVSRSAFYRLFSGVQDVVLWYRNYGAELGLYQIGRTLTCLEGNLVSVWLLARAKPLYTARVGSRASDEAFFMGASTRGHARAMGETLVQRHITVTPRLSYALEGVAADCYAVVSRWIQHDMDLESAVVAELLAEAYPPRLKEIFDKPPASISSTAVMRILAVKEWSKEQL